MPNLFIIGNGFDLAHKMKTSFNDFRDYLYLNYPEGMDNGLYVPDPVTGPSGEDLLCEAYVAGLIAYLLNEVAPDDKNNKSMPDWSEIEKFLGMMDLKECFDCVEPQCDKEGDRNYFWEREIAGSICGSMALAIPQITDFLSEWIRTVEISKFPICRFQELIHPKEDLFLTFNYTQTLEKLYACEKANVCHIHGAVSDNFYQDEKLILGHCGSKNYLCDESVPYEMGDGLQEIYEKLRKDTADQMRLHADFFNRIKNTKIEKIYSFGFSFAAVDLPYIQKVCGSIDTKQISWGLNIYDKESRRLQYMNTIKQLGFQGNFFTYST